MNVKLLFAAAVGLASLGASAATPHPVGSQIMANGFTYTVAGENLFPNGDFTQGLEGWTNGTYNPCGAEFFEVREGGPNGEKYLNALGNTGSGGDATIRRNIQLEPNKTYVLSFYHKGNGNSEYICTGLVNDLTADPGAARFFQPIKSDVWTLSGVAFTTTEATSVLGIKLGWLANNFSATDFFLAEVAPCATLGGTITKDYDQRYIVKSENLIANGDFSQGYEGWMLGQYQGQISEEGWDLLENGPLGAKYICAKAGGGSGGTSSLIKNVKLDPNKLYAFSFWYKGVVAGNSRVTLSGNENTDDNNKIFNCDGNANWKQKTMVFRPTEARPYLVFNFAWNEAGTSFANFNLVEVEDALAGKAFRFKQKDTGLLWSTVALDDNNRLVVADPDQEGYEYVFLVDQSALTAARPQALNLTSADGRTVCRRKDTNKWEMLYADINRDEIRAMFNVREHAGVYYVYNHDSNNILGTDGLTHNSYIFNDKGYGKNVEGKFTAAVELEEVPYAFSNRWVKEEAAEAEAFYASSENVGQWVPEARAEFRAALDAAYDVTACTSVQDIKDKIATIAPALEAYKAVLAANAGIESIDAANAAAKYFDINGRAVDAANLQNGVYIVRQGNTVTKVVR